MVLGQCGTQCTFSSPDRMLRAPLPTKTSRWVIQLGGNSHSRSRTAFHVLTANCSVVFFLFILDAVILSFSSSGWLSRILVPRSGMLIRRLGCGVICWGLRGFPGFVLVGCVGGGLPLL
ncbi:hypothetical protein EDB87DRAFT_123920 [Lactarius vividus]|nr:hypothetical protein EDB87DRAFT_123920 [Lactarius vividus]